jgi:hypothetical protein
MIPDAGTAILLLAIFALPGFITLVFRERLEGLLHQKRIA